jgi:hypothetical protein
MFVFVLILLQPIEIEAAEAEDEYEIVAIESTKEYFDAQPVHMQQIFYGLCVPAEYPTWPEGTALLITDLMGNYSYGVLVRRLKE